MAVNGWRTTFDALDNLNYRYFWLSGIATYAAMQMNMVVRGWLVYDLTDSALALGLVSAASGLPLLLISPLGGAIIDRVNKRNILLMTQILAGIVILAIAVLILSDAIALWQLVIAAVVDGVILAFGLPGRQAIVPQLVEQHRVMNAVALNSGAMNLNRIVAPALGGVFVGVMGIGGVHLLMVACYAISTAFLLAVPASLVDAPDRPLNGTIRTDINEGLRHVRHSPILLTLLAMAVVPILFGLPYMMLMPIFAADVFDVGASGLGYLMAATGIGALVGSTVVASLGDFSHKGILLIIASVLFGTFLILFATLSYFHLSLFLLFCVGMASSIQMAATNTLLMLHTEDETRGRVMGLYTMTIGIFPLAVLPAAAIAVSQGVAVVVAFGGALLIAFTLVISLLRPTLRRL